MKRKEFFKALLSFLVLAIFGRKTQAKLVKIIYDPKRKEIHSQLPKTYNTIYVSKNGKEINLGTFEKPTTFRKASSMTTEGEWNFVIVHL